MQDLEQADRPDDERRNSPRYQVILSYHAPSGKTESCDGVLGITACYCLMSEAPPLGEEVDLKIVLLGGNVAVKARGKVARTDFRPSYVGVVVLLEDLPLETERTIARWLDDKSLGTLVRAVA